MRAFGVLAALVLCAAAVHAQSTAGTIAGIVRDPQSAAVQGAKIAIVNPERGWEAKATTDENGTYSVYPVPQGLYRVSVDAPGFQSKTISGVQVDLDSKVRIDVDLALAAVGQSVVVEAVAPQVQRDSATMESVIENRQIVELPLDGRNILDLAYLSAGAAKNLTNAGLGDFAANGNRPNGNSFVIDGVSSRDEIRGQSSFSVSIDAVQQFKLKNSNATAEYGGGGTQMALVVKSGTNQLHGSLFAFNRSEIGQARSYFSRTNDLPDFMRSQYGGSVGGPIRRNKTFFFFNYEGQLQNSATQALYSIPTPAMRGGDFTGVHDASGRLFTLATPTLMPWTPVAGQPIYTTPNVVNPFYLADSASNPNHKNAAFAKAILGYYETPNSPGDLNNFVSARPTTNNGPQYTFRIDHQINSMHNVAVRATFNRRTLLQGTQAAYQLTGNSARNATNWVANLVSVFRPNLVNEFRFGWNFQQENETVTPARDLLTELGINVPVKLPESPQLYRIPTVTFNGTGAMFGMGYRPNIGGDATPQIFENGNRSFSDTLTWQKGRHEIKTGGQFRVIPVNYVQQSYPRGLFTYNGRTAANSTGYAVADILLGLPASTTLNLFPPEAKIRADEYSAFGQTDWRVNSRLTMNLGLRWEARRPPYDVNGQTSAFDLERARIVVASPGGKVSTNVYPVLYNAYQDLLVTATDAGWDEKRLLRTRWPNFGPRFGFAYSLNRRAEFVLRGGYGMFFSYPPYFVAQNSTGIPFGGSSATTSNATNLLSNEDPFRVGAAGRPNMTAMNAEFKNANNQQWNLALEKVLFRQTTVSVAYVGNKGTHLMGTQQQNPGQIRFPRFGNITQYISDFNSIYNSMQVEVRQRFWSGFSYQVNWTWAKSIDEMGGAAGNSAEDAEIRNTNRRLNRANSDFTQRHVFRANGVWQMPFGRRTGLGSGWHPAAKAVLGNWVLSGMTQWNTGVYATPQVQGTNLNGRPDVVAGVSWRLTDADRQDLAQKTGDPSYLDRSLRWFNPLAFASVNVNAGRTGNAGRNIILGPPLFNLDANLSKRFHMPGLPERFMGTFRFEVFNVLNHVNFFSRSLNLNINTATAGAFSQITGNPRQVQFGFRLDF